MHIHHTSIRNSVQKDPGIKVFKHIRVSHKIDRGLCERKTINKNSFMKLLTKTTVRSLHFSMLITMPMPALSVAVRG